MDSPRLSLWNLIFMSANAVLSGGMNIQEKHVMYHSMQCVVGVWISMRQSVEVKNEWMGNLGSGY